MGISDGGAIIRKDSDLDSVNENLALLFLESAFSGYRKSFP